MLNIFAWHVQKIVVPVKNMNANKILIIYALFTILKLKKYLHLFSD